MWEKTRSEPSDRQVASARISTRVVLVFWLVSGGQAVVYFAIGENLERRDAEYDEFPLITSQIPWAGTRSGSHFTKCRASTKERKKTEFLDLRDRPN